MAAEGTTTAPAPLPPRPSASSPPTVGTLLTRASAAGDRHRGCSSPRSLLSRILHRGRSSGGAGFRCRIRLLPRYCASASAAAANEDAVSAAGTAEAAKEPAVVTVAPTAVVAAQPAPREPGGSPRSSLGKQDALPAASLGLGASLVLLLSKSAAELSRMAELRAQMERLLLDARADVRSCSGRPSASADRTTTDCASVVKGPVARAGGGVDEGALSPSDDGSRAGTAASASRRASEDGGRRDMDRMEAELEAELSRLQLQRASDVEDDSPRRPLQTGAKSSASSRSHSTICSDSDNDDDRETDNSGGGESQNHDEEDEEEYARGADEGNEAKSPPHGGVSARELERRLHQLLQSRHEARIAELESALDRARRKLRETEREACRWRDTAKLATRFADESRLR